jgi:uncharacterized protein YqhQ
MNKASLLAALILSSLLPGAGLLLIRKGGWFAAYLVTFCIGVLLLFLFGLGALIIIPTWIVSFIHTFFAVNSYNRLAM